MASRRPRGPNARRWLLVPSALLLAVAASGSVALAQDRSDPEVTAAVQVTTNPDPARAHVVPQIARNPENGTLVIADTENRTRKTVDVHISTDGGRSWFPGGDPMVEPWTDSSGDPEANVNHTLTYDRDGVLYLAFQANDPRFSDLPRPDRPRHIFLARSLDDGRSFEPAVKVWEAPEDPDAPRSAGKRNNRPWVAVDPNDPRFVYVSWMQWHINDEPPSGNKALIARSTDGGRSFAEPFSLREGDPQGSYEARPAVDRHGTVHVIMAGRGFQPDDVAEDAPAPIRHVTYRSSTDHGQTWSAPVQLDQGGAGFAHNRKWGLRADPNSDTLYAVWYGHPDPRASLPDDDRDIFLRVSTDSGATWGDPVLVSSESAPLPNVHHFDPNIAVAPNGRLDVVWFDNRNSPVPADPEEGVTGFQDVWYTYSLDSGRTFAPNVKVTDRMIDRSYGIWSNNVDVHAPIGLVSTDETVSLTWQDSRNGTDVGSAEDTYFATVRHGEDEHGAGGSARPWLLAAAGSVLGIGLAMAPIAIVQRRRPG